MGRKLDALLGRNFKTSKFKALLNLAISRSSILSNQHHVRSSHARSDVKELLIIGQQDRAMLRVEHVIKEQNTVDVFCLIDFYLHLLLERVKLLAQNKECHEELREATSSLIYAASRCGEFPELQKIREILTSRFGKDFAARAVELRNSCGVCPKMVHKFSTRRPSFESKAKFLKEIASECGLSLHLEEDAPLSHDKEEKQKPEESEPANKAGDLDENALVRSITLFKDIKELEEFSESMKARRKYSGVAAAAQEAFKSAAHAAAAAKAAVELSMSASMEKDRHSDDDRDDSDGQEGIVLDFDLSSKTKALAIDHDDDSAASGETCGERLDDRARFEKARRVEDLSLEAEGENEIKDGESFDVRRQEEVEKESEAMERKISDLSPDNENRSDKRLSSASKDDGLVNEESF